MTKKIKTLILSLSFLVVGLMLTPSIVLAASSTIGNGCNQFGPNPAGQNACLSKQPIVKDIQMVVDFLSAGVAIVIAGSIIVAGIQYTLAGNQPQVLTAARNRIINSVIALFAFLLTFAFLQWLIPGGIFK